MANGKATVIGPLTVGSVIYFIVCFGIGTRNVQATHFRGGTISWKPSDSFSSTYKEIIFTFKLGWRLSRIECDERTITSGALVGEDAKWHCMYGCKGVVASTREKCTEFNLGDDWMYGSNTFKYVFDSDGPIEISYMECCWLTDLLVGAGGEWALTTILNLGIRSDTGGPNSSPVTAMAPMIKLRVGVPDVIDLAVRDTDGDRIRCRLGRHVGECGTICSLFTEFTLDEENCVIRYDPVANVTGKVPVAVMVEDYHRSNEGITMGKKTFKVTEALSTVPMQFLVIVEVPPANCADKPLIEASIPASEPVKVRQGTNFTFDVTSTPCDGTTSIEEFILIAPIGVRKTPTIASSGKYTTRITWTPTAEQDGSNLICVRARSSNGVLSEPICITAEVPKATAFCAVVGGSHFITFDKSRYNFYGMCKYRLAGTIPTAGHELTPFNITLSNEESLAGHNAVSMGVVEAQAMGQKVTVDSLRDVYLNDVAVSLPVRMKSGLRVEKSGRGVSITLSLAIRIYIDDATLSVQLSQTYAGQIEGLCGNYNGEEEDDLTSRGGSSPASDETEFATSFRVGNKKRRSCISAMQRLRNKVECATSTTNKAARQCNVLIEKNGGCFSECHDVIDPKHFYLNCVSIICQSSDGVTALDVLIRAYTDVCQREGVKVCDWRSKLGIGLECPPNSHYEKCSTTVPATCADSMSTRSPNPTKSCVEGCVCNKGHILSGSICVPESECGCMIEDIYYQKGFTYRTEACNRECVCGDGCRDVDPCDTGSTCVKDDDGFHRCAYSQKSSATCKAITDPHYVTFDGTKFDSMGTCAYIMVRSKRNNTRGMAFSVIAVNEQSKESTNGSHVKEVHVQFGDGHTMALLKDHVVKIDGVEINPGSTTYGVQIRRVGRYVIADFNFGLVIRWDGIDMLRITAWSPLRNMVEGMCGDWDGNAENDFAVKATGENDFDLGSFVKSWRTEGYGTEGCYEFPGTPTLEPPCENDTLLAQYHEECRGLINPKGSFKDCHGLVDPTNAFSNCLFDLCVFEGDQDVKERIFSSYAEDCLDENALPPLWRDVENLIEECIDSVYSPCMHQCQPTCSDPTASECFARQPNRLGDRCTEGCVCEEGYVLSRGKCVLLRDCGCMIDGRYEEIGFEFATADCEQICVCEGPDNIDCRAGNCQRKGDSCRPKDNGYFECIRRPRRRATCKAVTDPHYMTFDRKNFDSMGTCSYTMVRTKEEADVSPFRIVTVNEQPWPNRTVSHVKESYIHVGEHLVVSMKQGGVISVNQRVVQPGTNISGVEIRKVGRFWVANFPDLGFYVKWDGQDRLRISVWNVLRGKVEGLCGSFDDDDSNDFMTPQGVVVQNTTLFVESWRTTEHPSDDCRREFDAPDQDNLCSLDDQERHRKTCGTLLNPNGIYASCVDVVDAEKYVKDCIFDLCAYNGDEQYKERLFSEFVEECLKNNITIQNNWRELEDLEPLSCTENSHEESSIDQCQPTCTDRDGSICRETGNLGPERVEGCICDEGYTLSGDKCVLESECGCVDKEGTYFQQGFVFRTENCSTECECMADGTFSCSAVDGCPKGNRCRVDTDGHKRCVKHIRRRATCKAVTDPHYMTFDGVKYDSMGTCAYILTRSKAGTTGTQFRVVTVNERPKPGKIVSHVKEIFVHVGDDITLTFKAGPIVTINGEVVLPGTIVEGIEIREVGRFTVAEFPFGLAVKWDGFDRIRVMAWGILKSTVEGLCGDFNDDPTNDLITPRGELLTNFTDFVNSWKVSGYDTEDCVDAPDEPTICDTPEKLEQAQETCDVLIDPLGPFFPCFKLKDPQGAFNDCVIDMCAYDGDRAIRERIMASYGEDCRDEVADEEFPPGSLEFRDEEEQSSLCEEDSHFETCMLPCQPTCSDKDASRCLIESTSISGSCAEGCVCDEGFLKSGTVCVREEDCGCQIEGRYVPKGFVYNNRNCTVECTCVGKEEVFCVSSSGCEKGYRCRINDEGRRACIPHVRRRATCKAVTDPHYMTFDGQKFDSMGICAYIMTRSIDGATVPEPFRVVAVNEQPDPDQIVSNVKEVHIFVGQELKVSFLPGAAVKINDEDVLPGSRVRSVQIRKVGKFTVAEFDFGLVVKWDGVDRLRIMAWASLKGQVEGICGDFNDDPQNDFRTPRGRIENDITKFVRSWRARDLSPPGCVELPEPPGMLNDTICASNETAYHQFHHDCSVLTALDGPYAQCHDIVDPNPALEQCLFDMCHTTGSKQRKDIFNRNVQEYAQDCLEGKNLTIINTNVLDCRSNETEIMGMEQCQPTCNDPDASNCKANATLGGHLVPGCKCSEGLLLGGNICVEPEGCGCLIDEKYYDRGFKYMTSGCDEECECVNAGDIACKRKRPCRTTERCTLENGLYQCTPRIRKMATCKAITDPHYTTFDGKSFNTTAWCSYTMLQGLRGSDAPEFRIVVTHEREKAGSSHIARVNVRFGDNFKMVLTRGLRVKINGMRYNAGSTVQGVIIRHVGLFTLIEFPFGMVIRWDSSNRLRVTVWEKLKGKVEGLCGRYNDDTSDDFTMENGEVTDDITEFVESWHHERHSSPKCSHRQHDDGLSDCDDPAILDRYQNECNVLLDADGPFADCHPVADQVVANAACVADLCRMDGDLAYKDSVLTSYTHDCLEFLRQPEPWRIEQDLVIVCPENSKFVRCMHQCQPSCSDPVASLCKKKVPYLLGEHCVEGCRCNSGYTLSHDKCVQEEECGCMIDGVYFVKGFKYKNEGCTQECECLGGNEVTCRDIPDGCLVNKKCLKAASGYHQCLPSKRRRATCRAITDPHYTTFDGTKFDSQGVCSYVMVKSKENATVDPFSVVAVNEQPNPHQTVSHVKEVHIQFGGHRLVFHMGPVAMLDGEAVNAGTRESGLKLEMSGRFLTAKFKFGLEVQFDGADRLRVSIIEVLRGQVEGVCGDFDDDPTNDLTHAISGEIVTDAEDFVNSWRVQGFNDDCSGPLADFLSDRPPFKCPSNRIEAAEKACSVLINAEGALKGCQRFADATTAFENCVLDLCAYEGDPSIHDRVISDFSDDCREEGGRLDVDWRKQANLSEVQCPSHSHFDSCMDHCQPTCWDIDASDCHSDEDSNQNCVEGCVADEGYVFSANEYVPATECGCFKDNRYYKSGEIFYTEGCETLCECRSGVVACRVSICTREEHCVVNKAGKLDCVKIEKSTCHVYGSTHISSFDGRTFDTSATCNFVLARRDFERGDPSSRQMSFVVYATITKSDEDSGLVEARAVRLRLQSQGIVIILRPDAQAKIGGKPYHNWKNEDESGLVRVDRRGTFTVIKTSFGLELAYDGNNLRITLPKSFAEKTSGLCGNMNGDPKDDFSLKDGSANQNIENFLLSFAGSGCDAANHLPPRPCSRKNRLKWGSITKCGAMLDLNSEFANCSKKLDAEMHFENCVQDVCRADVFSHALPQALKTFAYECAAIDEPVCEWRRDLMLQIACPVNSHYVGCTSACEDTCGAAKETECRYQQVEDCVCDEGYIRSNGQCVAKAACGGCLVKRKMVPKGFTYRTKDCMKECTCVGNEVIECEDTGGCISRAKCGKDGAGFVQCLIVPRRKAKCQAFGTGHFVSFDGSRFNTTTTCLLTMARSKVGAMIQGFSVTVDMQPAKKSDFSRVAEVIIRAGNLDMIMAQGKTVMVNGRNVAIGSVLETVTIRKIGRYVAAVFNFGLTVRWDGRQNVRIDARRPLAGQVEGLCGDFDEDEMDDFRTPFGVVETDTSVFVNSWKEEKSNFGCRLERPFSSPCDDSLTSLIEYRDYCVQAYSDEVSSYALCNLFEYCLFEMCASGGDRDYIAATIHEFYETCSEEHRDEIEPQKIEIPVLECSTNSHFNGCMSQCQATCSDQEASVCRSEESLQEGCVSGCQCDNGFLLDGEDCVKPEECGCVGLEGEYFPNTFDSYLEECKRKCQCNEGVLSCEETRCYPGQYCGYRDDNYGCHWQDKCKYNNGGCDHMCSWANETVSCRCLPGYNLAVDGMKCQSVKADCNATKENFTEWKSNTMQAWINKLDDFMDALKKGTETGELAHVCKTEWTKWFDVSDPDATGDDESLQALRAENPASICQNPLAIEAQLTDGRSSHSTGLVIRTMSPLEGLRCFNSDQREGETCGDFRVRYLCLQESV